MRFFGRGAWESRRWEGVRIIPLSVPGVVPMDGENISSSHSYVGVPGVIKFDKYESCDEGMAS